MALHSSVGLAWTTPFLSQAKPPITQTEHMPSSIKHRKSESFQTQPGNPAILKVATKYLALALRYKLPAFAHSSLLQKPCCSILICGFVKNTHRRSVRGSK